MKINADNIHQKLTELSNAWADANADAEKLEKNEKILFSELVLNSDATSVAAKEHEARASKWYKTHVDGMIEARRIANRAKGELNSAECWLDWKRTEAATERAALRIAP